MKQRTEAKAFREEYTNQAKAVLSKKEKKKKKDHKTTIPPHIEQKEARKFAPPGCYVWTSYSRGEWNGHCAPNPRVYEPYSRYAGGSQEALKMCLRRLWDQHLEKHGKSRDDCPYTNLFD